MVFDILQINCGQLVRLSDRRWWRTNLAKNWKEFKRMTTIALELEDIHTTTHTKHLRAASADKQRVRISRYVVDDKLPRVSFIIDVC